MTTESSLRNMLIDCKQENNRLTKKVLFMEEAYSQKADKLDKIMSLVEEWNYAPSWNKHPDIVLDNILELIEDDE